MQRHELEAKYLNKTVHLSPNAAHFKAGHLGIVTGTAETSAGIALVLDFDGISGFVFDLHILTILKE